MLQFGTAFWRRCSQTIQLSFLSWKWWYFNSLIHIVCCLCQIYSVRSWEEETGEGGAKPFRALLSTAASSSTEWRRESESMELTVGEPDTDALWAAEWENAHRFRDVAHENSAYRLHLSTNISPSKKKKRRKGAGQNLQKEQSDLLEKNQRS